MRITCFRDSQWTRYTTRYGRLSIFVNGMAFFSPALTPCVSLPISREDAATCLRAWRIAAEEAASNG